MKMTYHQHMYMCWRAHIPCQLRYTRQYICYKRIYQLACGPGLHNKLFLNGVVLTNVCLDLLDDGTVLNLK